jgi:hypothetical protein
MTILLRWLVNNAWVFYVLCAIGVLVYLGRALAAQRERQLSVFSLERETATSRLVQAVIAMLVFAALGGLIFASSTIFLPTLPPFNGEAMPEPTPSSGLNPPTLVASPTATAAALVPTFTPAPEESAGTPAPPAEGEPAGENPTATPEGEAVPEATPAVEPTTAPEPTIPPSDAATSGQTNTRFADFAALVSYSLPSGQLSSSSPVPLILYWQALEGQASTNYVVFTHLVGSDGQLVAQHDGQPAGGARPTTTWTNGERIADPHQMAFQDPGYRGEATILVGMYDVSGVRVLTDSGASYVVLPVTVQVVP